MTTYYVKRICPTWVEEWYSVDAENEKDAQEKAWEGDCDYLGHNLGDTIEFALGCEDEDRVFAEPKLLGHSADLCLAAPAMLEALKQLAEWPLKSACLNGRPARDAAESLCNVRRFARAAIAQATANQPCQCDNCRTERAAVEAVKGERT